MYVAAYRNSVLGSYSKGRGEGSSQSIQLLLV